MRIILFGPPGSGRSTYASAISSRLGFLLIDLGLIFRDAIKRQTDLGKRIAEYVNSGKLVPDEIVEEVLREKISKDGQKGFILDDFPRLISQAEILEKITDIDVAINLQIPDKAVIARLAARVVCKNCGETFSERFLKPKVAGVCDKCGGELVHRKDDSPDVVKERLKVFKKQTKPLVKYYKDKGILRSVRNTDPGIDPEIMIGRILKIIEEIKK